MLGPLMIHHGGYGVASRSLPEEKVRDVRLQYPAELRLMGTKTHGSEDGQSPLWGWRSPTFGVGAVRGRLETIRANQQGCHGGGELVPAVSHQKLDVQYCTWPHAGR